MIYFPVDSVDKLNRWYYWHKHLLIIFWLSLMLSITLLFETGFFNTLRPRQNCCHLTKDIVKCVFVYYYWFILLIIPLRYNPNDATNDKLVVVQIMVWQWTVDKNIILALFAHAYIHHSASMGQIMNTTIGQSVLNYKHLIYTTVLSATMWYTDSYSILHSPLTHTVLSLI